jgi:hypothetical protein
MQNGLAYLYERVCVDVLSTSAALVLPFILGSRGGKGDLAESASSRLR